MRSVWDFLPSIGVNMRFTALGTGKLHVHYFTPIKKKLAAAYAQRTPIIG